MVDDFQYLKAGVQYSQCITIKTILNYYCSIFLQINGYQWDTYKAFHGCLFYAKKKSILVYK